MNVSAMVDIHVRLYYTFCRQLGKICVTDWEDAHSPWAERFDLIINCCHKKGRYRRWPSRDIHMSLGPRPVCESGTEVDFDLGLNRLVVVWSVGFLFHCAES